MSHIGLLMTGVLTTGQPSLPKFPVQPPFQSDKPMQQSTEERSDDIVAATEITPPEFIQDGNFQVTHSPLNKEQQNIQSSDELVIARSRSVSKRESLKPNPKFSNQNLPILGFGSSGVSVKVLQRVLLSNGYAVRVDGVFGALTESAVKAFQNRRNLIVDGVVGFRTWRELTK